MLQNSKSPRPTHKQYGVALQRHFSAHLAPLSQKRKPQAYGIFIFKYTNFCYFSDTLNLMLSL